MGVGTYLALAAVLFGIGAAGFLTRRNMLIQLMSIELMLNSVNVVLLAFNRVHSANHEGQVFAFFVIAVAAAEAAVGLAILVAYYRIKKTIDTDDARLLKY
ncbi:MAG: NADH-quinone oxidoreductase subunit NuoK [Deltaproteobacteria bacterium]|nr:NADH-quinone oxidoreductase subunit NuoK [Deltaproteobacteria bacterium]NND27757.1 NADH-quinone oxidoreductase subunit NuoK [Myxococcales bacterium]MBT8466153.1 NADH-quinone oxidoreductase subunit NuoK [Deltaproteobacteria bacterium]MBT8482157.1 NADH-quinone oxidoreductase subunit NuoK [Deltaproteobacteria bacterium]NNK07094.1 NADH-quinone oxidoreductase subunit NuoK [Myxococcales bacterium]